MKYKIVPVMKTAINTAKIAALCHINAKSPLEITALNPSTEYVIGNQALKYCNTSGINSSGNVPALVVSCKINTTIAIKRPGSASVVTRN